MPGARTSFCCGAPSTPLPAALLGPPPGPACGGFDCCGELCAVKTAVTVKGETNFKNSAKDTLITTQLRTAMIHCHL